MGLIIQRSGRFPSHPDRVECRVDRVGLGCGGWLADTCPGEWSGPGGLGARTTQTTQSESLKLIGDLPFPNSFQESFLLISEPAETEKKTENDRF